MFFGVALCGLALALATGSSAQAAALASSESSILGAVNATRAAHGLRPLAVDGALTRAARASSVRLLRTGVLSHGAFGSRLGSSGAQGPFFGENLAWGVGSRASAQAILRSWLASPGHRANLLRPGFRRIGIGASVGSFLGYDGATVVTADFAGR